MSPSKMAQQYLIQGREVKLPVVVREALSGTAFYDVDAAAAARLIPGTAYEIVESEPGRTQCIIALIDYRDCDLDDYNEVSIAFSVRPVGSDASQDGTFIYSLPVTQRFTCEAGSTIWGYPKSVEEIDYEYADDHLRGELRMNGELVLRMRLPRSQPEGEPMEIDLRTWSYLDGQPVETSFRNTTASAIQMGAEGVELELGSHRLAEDLRSLGLPRDPMMTVWTERMSARFEAPRPLR
jgi:hypothetical protein